MMCGVHRFKVSYLALTLKCIYIPKWGKSNLVAQRGQLIPTQERTSPRKLKESVSPQQELIDLLRGEFNEMREYIDHVSKKIKKNLIGSWSSKGSNYNLLRRELVHLS